MRGEETYRRTTREKIVLRGNTTIRTVDSTSTYLPMMGAGWVSRPQIIFFTPSACQRRAGPLQRALTALFPLAAYWFLSLAADLSISRCVYYVKSTFVCLICCWAWVKLLTRHSRQMRYVYILYMYITAWCFMICYR